jgi:hypothetical protein
MFALKLAVCLLLGFGFLQHDNLRLGQYQAFLGASLDEAATVIF